MSKPKFYQAVLQEVKGSVLDHVYPHLKGKGQLTMKERMGSDNAECPECKENEWWLYPNESVMVAQGGKPYIECLNCGHITHL
jgi:Zn ribbon nucleic-acid-binding protein